MEIKSKLKELTEKVNLMKEQITTEEATKTAFILPFINLLGYDIFNPTEVVPEFTADIGLKKGEKVDYAIFENGNPILIIECKHWKEDLDVHNSQLFRYFHVSKSRFALLTNGIEYRFYTDLEHTNKMDEKPFLEFNISKLKDSTVLEISKFHKSNFDIDKIVSNASSLKYTKEINKVFNTELNESSDDFVRFFASRVYNGRLTEKVMEQFRELVQKAINQLISEKVNDRLQSALSKEAVQQDEENIEVVEESKIETTEEELEGYRVIVAILRRKLEKSRIAYRDTQSYFGILLDDNNRKPLCRLHLNGGTKYIGLIDKNKKEIRENIETIDDIYNFEEKLLDTVDFYLN
ncbi:type I restriction endonuclease [Lutimonas halocynthiae]|uniref:type I restriction endonuclease n=1 Tax=Lutimonas halocynthiae TaxID=1446477 RepID=UPI0025B437E8|nr:type I restriction endonuclease [Lutimonas halocynthiae]MDN3643743.1 type I restriction endonuclease [Lutimonas halocynthiae]